MFLHLNRLLYIQPLAIKIGCFAQ
jgi:hypothetical protein